MGKEYINTATGEMTESLQALPGVNKTKKGVYKNVVERDVDREALTKYNGLLELDNAYRQLRYNPGEGLKQFTPKAVEFEGHTGVGQSTYDDDINNINQLDDINNTRGELQPTLDKWAAATAKMGTLAGTTFLNTTLGTITGLGTIVSKTIDNYNQGKGFDIEWNGLWNNEFNRTMTDINKLSEELFKNYYTNEERDNPWYKNIGTANFWADGILKNMGFTIGAIGAGVLTGGALTELGVGKGLTSVVSTLAAATGEASVEAINTYDSTKEASTGRIEAYHKAAKEQLDNKYLQLYKQYDAMPNSYSTVRTSDGQVTMVNNKAKAISALNEAYNQELNALDNHTKDLHNQAEQEALKAGNITMGLNQALLSVSDAVQFGKTLSGGYANARKAAALLAKNKLTGEAVEGATNIAKGIIKGEVEFAANKGFGKQVAKNIIKNYASEGFEEGAQNLISNTSQINAAYNLNTFAGHKINPNVQDDVDGFISAGAQALAEQYGSPESPGWQEVTMGGISGILGVPMFKKGKNGGIRPTWSGGVKEAIEEAKDKFASNEVVDKVNNAISKPEFLNRYQGLIRHNSFQSMMDDAVNEGNEYKYKESEAGQLISDILMFRDANQIDVLKKLYNNYTDLNDEDLKKVVSGLNVDGTKTNLKEGESLDKVRQDIKDRAKYLDTFVKNIDEIHDKHLAKFGDKYTKDLVEELTYLAGSMYHHKDAFNENMDKVKESLNSILSSEILPEETANTIKSLLSNKNEDLYNKLLADKNLLNNETINKVLRENKDRYSDIYKLIKQLQELKSQITNKNSSTPVDLTHTGISINNQLATLEKELNKLKSEEVLLKGEDTYKAFSDAAMSLFMTNLIADKYKKYKESPDDFNIELDKDKQDSETTTINNQNKAVYDDLNNTTSTQEFRLKVSKEVKENNPHIDNIIDLLVKENHPIATEYKKLTSYYNALDNYLNNPKDANPNTVEATKELLKYFKNDPNINSLADLKEFINQDPEDLTPELRGSVELLQLINGEIGYGKIFQHEVSLNVYPNGDKPTTGFNEQHNGLFNNYKRKIKLKRSKNKELRRNRRQNKNAIKNKILLIQKQRNELLNSISSKADLINYIDALLKEVINNSSENVDKILKTLNNYIKLIDSNSKSNTKWGKNILDNVENEKDNLHTLFELMNDIANRLSELKSEHNQLQLIAKDMNNQISYYNSLISDLNNKLTHEEIKAKINKIENKKLILLKIISKLQKVIENIKDLLKSHIDNTLQSIKEFEEFSNIFSPKTATELKKLIDNNDDSLENYHQLNTKYELLQQQVTDNITSVEAKEDLIKSKQELLNILNNKVDSYNNKQRYLSELLREKLYNKVTPVIEEVQELIEEIKILPPIGPGKQLQIDFGEETTDEVVDITENIPEEEEVEEITPEEFEELVIPKDDNTIKDNSMTPNYSEDTQKESSLDNKKTNRLVNSDGITRDTKPVDKLRKYFTLVIHEFIVNLRNNNIFVKNGDNDDTKGYKTIVTYLENQGAFEYVNKGNLKVNDELYLMKEPSLVLNAPSADKNNMDSVILLAKKLDNGSYQVVGVLPALTNKFEGLDALRTRFNNTYESLDKTKPYVYTETIKVHKIMPGFVKLSQTDKNFKDTVNNRYQDVIFGISVGEKIDTNGKIADYLINRPVTNDNGSGRLYVLIKGGDGRYIPMLVKMKRIGQDTTLESLNNNNPYKQGIENALKLLSTARTEDELTKARNELANWLYVGDLHIDFYVPKGETTPRGIRIRGDKSNTEGKVIYFQGKPEYKSKGPVGGESILQDFTESTFDPSKDYTTEEIYNELLQHINNEGFYFQVSTKKINDEGGFNQALIETDLLYSNIDSLDVVSSWFYTDYIDDNGVAKTAILDMQPKEVVTTTQPHETPVNKGERVTIGKMSYIMYENGDIHDKNDKPIKSISNQDRLTISDMYKYKTKILGKKDLEDRYTITVGNNTYFLVYGANTVKGTERGYNLTKNTILTPDLTRLLLIKKGYIKEEVVDKLEDIDLKSLEGESIVPAFSNSNMKGTLAQQGTSVELEVKGDSGKEFLLTVDRKGNISLFSEKQSDGSYKAGEAAPKEEVNKLYNKYVSEKIRNAITNWLNSFTGSWAAPETQDGKNYTKAEKELNKELAALESKQPQKEVKLDSIRVITNSGNITINPDGTMFYDNGNEVNVDTIKNKALAKKEEKEGTLRITPDKKYAVLSDDRIISLNPTSAGEEVYKEGTVRNRILESVGKVKQEVKLETKPVEVKEEIKPVVDNTPIDLLGNDFANAFMNPSSETSEIKLNYSEKDVEDLVNQNKITNFDSVPQVLKSRLESQGVNNAIWNALSNDEKLEKLKCVR